MRRGLTDLSEVLSSIRIAISGSDARSQLDALSEFYYKLDASNFHGVNPFDLGYRDRVLGVYKKISKNGAYDPEIMEKSNALDGFDVSRKPLPYRFGSSRAVGEFLTCYGWILSNLDVKEGADTLEYGSGEGQLAIHLARMGCNVHAIDIEPRFLDAIQRQCRTIGVSVRTKVGKFGDGFDGKKFDRIIFFEAFHHCLEHYDVLIKIRDILKIDGFVVFSGEPIIPDGSPDREVLPYPWGLRLDGESVRSIAEFGWMELGYAEGYFVELLSRAGYAVELVRCQAAWRADTYIGRPFAGRYPIERNTLIRFYEEDSGWYDSEVTHRWTNGDALFPVPDLGYRKVRVGLSNFGPERNTVSISCMGKCTETTVASGETAALMVDIPAEGGRLRIQSDRFQPSTVNPASPDTRVLGVAVKSVEFLD